SVTVSYVVRRRHTPTLFPYTTLFRSHERPARPGHGPRGRGRDRGALPGRGAAGGGAPRPGRPPRARPGAAGRALLEPARGLALRSEEHTSGLQSPCNLVCRRLLEKTN